MRKCVLPIFGRGATSMDKLKKVGDEKWMLKDSESGKERIDDWTNAANKKTG